MALKKYYSLLLFETEEELSLLKSYKKKLSSSSLSKPLSTDLLADSSPYYPLLQSYFAKDKLPVSAQKWCAESYETNSSHPEHLIHTTLAGHKVRSKSEVIIANLLYTNHIPYRYEAALPLKEFTAYPDFTIMHPVTNKIFYWEHFGMMDNAPYCDTACNKLKTYCYNGIFPSMQLITTYETSKCPIPQIRFSRSLHNISSKSIIHPYMKILLTLTKGNQEYSKSLTRCCSIVRWAPRCDHSAT